jgi:hypothetical protein
MQKHQREGIPTLRRHNDNDHEEIREEPMVKRTMKQLDFGMSFIARSHPSLLLCAVEESSVQYLKEIDHAILDTRIGLYVHRKEKKTP